MSFFKAFFSSCLGAFVALIVFCFFFFIAMFSFVGQLSKEEKPNVPKNSILHLKLDVEFSELQKENLFEGIPVLGEQEINIGLIELKQAIKNAKEDSKIEGIFLQISYPRTGFATLKEIRESLLDFRSEGKWVLAYSEVMSEGAYYLASVADQVFIHPEGEVEFDGLVVEIGFYKKLFEKLDIKPEVFRVGDFKSAVEPFLFEKMSEENRLQLTELVNSIHDQMLADIAGSRNIAKAELKNISDNQLIRNSKQAVDNKLIDDLLYFDEFLGKLKDRVGISGSDDLSLFTYKKYSKSFSTYKNSKNEIAVIVAEGTIMPGISSYDQQTIGSETFAKEIRRARENDNVKAIVMRINSPGGEFRSSDVMWRELKLASAVKPVIASMGDYAASGGYYLAMACDTIVAQPQTITGSIGIFGVLFDFSAFLESKIGITFDEVKTGKFGDAFTVTRPLTQAEKNIWQKKLDDHYATFRSKAAEGRDQTVEEIEKVASGRVWTGDQAIDRKLVDILGGFDDAIQVAAEKAGIEDDFKVRYYPKQVSFWDNLFNKLDENVSTRYIQSKLGEHYLFLDHIERLKELKGAQARMPFELSIH